jgi:hypothetical protein
MTDNDHNELMSVLAESVARARLARGETVKHEPYPHIVGTVPDCYGCHAHRLLTAVLLGEVE